MFRMSTIAGVAAASFLATSAIVSGATGSIASSPVAEAAPASATIVQTVSTGAAATPATEAQTDGCARKVKVVYAGYGEAASGCAISRR